MSDDLTNYQLAQHARGRTGQLLIDHEMHVSRSAAHRQSLNLDR